MGEKAPRAGRQMAVYKAAQVSADQLSCEWLEAHDAVDEVERDCACPDPDEGRSPAPPTPGIDDLMKHTEQKRAQTAAHKDVRRRPDVFDDRKRRIPDAADKQTDESRTTAQYSRATKR